MKRFLILFVVFIFLFTSVFSAYCSMLTSAVAKLAPASALGGGATSFTVPALIRGTTSGGGSVSSWITLALPGSTQAKILGAVTGIGLGLAADYLIIKANSWYQQNNLNKDGTINQIFNIPDGKSNADYNGPGIVSGYTNVVNGGIYADTNAAYAAAAAWRSANGTGGGGHVANATPECNAYYYAKVPASPNPQNAFFYYPKTGQATHQETVTSSTTPTQREGLVNADIAAGGSRAANAGKAVSAAVDIVATTLDQPVSNPYNLNDEIKAAIAAALSQALTAGQLAALEGQATTPDGVPVPDVPDYNAMTPAQIAAALQGALSGQGLSANQIAAAITAAQGANITQAQVQAAVQAAVAAALAGATSSSSATPAEIQDAVTAALGAKSLSGADVKTKVKEAVDDETGVTAPLDPSLSLPDKLSLTAILTAFMADLNRLPIIDTLRGITVNCSGTSSLCVALPAKYGGNICYNASGLTDDFNMIGSVLLSMTTIMGFIWLFKG